MSGQIPDAKWRVTQVIKGWEDQLTDGYQFYCDDVEATVDKMAEEILRTLLNFQAVNAHDDLVAAREELKNTVTILTRVLDGGHIGSETRYIITHRVKAIRAALPLVNADDGRE